MIAEEVGCTRAAVSYALRNDPQVSEKLRDRVQEVAHRLGWRPDAMLARQMALVRATAKESNLPTVAIVYNKPRAVLAWEHSTRRQLEGACARATELGYGHNIFNLYEEPLSPPRLLAILRARGIVGIVFIGTLNPGIPKEHLALGYEFPCAIVGVRYPEIPFHVSISDHLSLGRIAITALLELGYRRPGVVMARGIEKGLQWGFSGGLYTGLVNVPPENRLDILYTGNDELGVMEQDFPAIEKWLRQKKPDAILSLDTFHLVRLLDQLPESQRVPHFSLAWDARLPMPGGIDQRFEVVGAGGVDLVVGQLHRGESGLPKVPKILMTPGTWVMAEAPAKQR
ncbi:LacI family DNA-binding transcriptional regulator [Nibricoccus sp. IMCC34717]|uniref:LacI family DNA-binding transcriptional regulator n=1 Tax=Nibricoccus sp. IMCC34717 TaxID=3034021 RepID=UPI003850F165